MPPIDPTVLRNRTAALAAQFKNAPAVAAGVRSLLDDYADRTHRPSPKVASSAVDNSYKAPAPVVRAIVAALRPPAKLLPAAALAVADRVWQGGSREERRIASELVGLAAPLAPAEAMALVESWLPQIESGETADVLAEFGLGPLILANPAPYLELAQRWAASPLRWVRRFALAALLPLIRDKHWDNVPGALAVLKLVMTEADGEVRRAAGQTLELLGPKSPGEVSRFLQEQARRSNNHTHLIVRSALAGLPEAEQMEIVKVLRG